MRALVALTWVYCAAADYLFDSSFRADLSSAASIAISHGKIFIGTESGTPVYIVDKSGKVQSSFGKGDVVKAHGIRIERNASGGDTVWVTDMKAGKLVQFSLEGKKLGSFGSEGSGKGQFTAPADIAFLNNVAFASDGDMGNANRVTAWQLDDLGMPTGKSPLWVTPAEFKSPHSITVHPNMNKLIVANRWAKNIKILDPATGNVEGTLQCDALKLQESNPYGVRMIGNTLFVVSNNGHKADQFIHIVDYPPGMKCGNLLQTIPISAKECATPHLLGIDHDTEDVYVACLASKKVLKLKKSGLVHHVIV